MREPSLARDAGRRTSGVIDTLSAGYGVVNRRVWILLIPVLLDLFLWLGPQVSVAPLLGQALTAWRAPATFSAEQARGLEEMRRGMLGVADELNLLWLLAPTQVGVPSAAALFGGRGSFQFVDSWGAALGVALGSVLIGLALGSVYYALLAQQVRDGATTPLAAFWHAYLGWRRVIGLLLALSGLGALLGLPLAFVLASAALVSPALASFGVAFVLLALLWLQVYLFFAPHAIFVSEVGPLQAVRRSVTLVRAHFWPAVLLISLVWLILLGMSQVWVYLAGVGGTAGTLLGILGNAYVASGLVAAAMVFYWERAGTAPAPAGPGPAARA